MNVTTNSPQREIHPIEGLSPNQRDRTICAQVKQKSSIRNYSNSWKKGRLFDVTLMDETGEIRAVAFDGNADNFFPKLQEGKTYYISGAQIIPAKRGFATAHPKCELVLSRETAVDNYRHGPVLEIQFKFTQLDQLVNYNTGDMIDVLGIVQDVSDVIHITTRLGDKFTKRELIIVDCSGVSVRMTLWESQAETYDESCGPVIAWKGVKVDDFGGLSLSMISSSIMEISPHTPEAYALRSWYDAHGGGRVFLPQATSGPRETSDRSNPVRTRLLDDVLKSNVESDDELRDFSSVAAIMSIDSDSVVVLACQACEKKVIEEHEGWLCKHCNKVFDKPSYRYNVTMKVADHSGAAWFNCFNDAGSVIFNTSADQLIELKNRDGMLYKTIISNAIGTSYNFTCRTTIESFEKTTLVCHYVERIFPLDYKEEGNYLKKLLSSPWARS